MYQVLEISDNGVRHSGAVAIAEALKNCPKLLVLLMESALIKDTGGLAVVEALRG